MDDQKQNEKMTGETIQMADKEIETLLTYHRKRSGISAMIAHLGANLERNEKDMWRAVRDLYPELNGYDLVIDWQEKRIRIRHKLTTWELEQYADRGTW